MITRFTTYNTWAHREETTISKTHVFFYNLITAIERKRIDVKTTCKYMWSFFHDHMFHNLQELGSSGRINHFKPMLLYKYNLIITIEDKKLQERKLKRHKFNTVQIACSHSNDRSKLNDQHNRQRPIRWTRESSLRQMTKISSLRAPITTRRSAMASISISRDFPYRTAKIGELRRCKSNNLRAHSTHIIIITTATWLRRWNGKKATCRRRGGYPKKLSDMNEWRNEWMVLTRHLIKGSLIPLGEWLRSKYPYISLTPSN